MALLNEDNKFKEIKNNNKMNLDELLKQKHPVKTPGQKKVELNEVYAIIYRIYCIPEKKSYIGQTYSHEYSRLTLIKKNILTRCKHHYNDKCLEVNKNKPLYVALTKYSAEQFIVYEEERLYNKDIADINQKEGEYMVNYNTLSPNGYNIEEIGKKYSKLFFEHSIIFSDHCIVNFNDFEP
jgi:hypothetical protein